MTKVEAGNYIFIHYGFSDNEHAPQLTFLAPGAKQFCVWQPRNQIITLQIDTSQRFCTGWHDLATATSHPCPDSSLLAEQYEQCRHCLTKTGFNPAFYNTSSLSKQQAARNQLPHTLYLAHFGPGIVKVGITWAGRGIKRLLEQGARSALLVKTLPNAITAREYEAKAAKLPGIVETVQHKVKHRLLLQPYNVALGAQELLSAEQRLSKEIGVVTEGNQPQSFDNYYLSNAVLKTNKIIDLHDQMGVSGTVIGMIGSLLIIEQEGIPFVFPLSKRRGYRLSLSYEAQANQHTPQQISLW